MSDAWRAHVDRSQYPRDWFIGGYNPTLMALVYGMLAFPVIMRGWLRSRLRRQVVLTRRDAAALAGIKVDGDPVTEPSRPALSGSDLLSAELDTLARDPVYEAAVRATAA